MHRSSYCTAHANVLIKGTEEVTELYDDLQSQPVVGT